MGKDIKIAVACHKPYWMCQDPVYNYVEAGAALHASPLPGMEHDCTGEQISSRNETFCELTVLYWAWKNWESEYIGLCHYRRFFAARRFGRKKKRILKREELSRLLDTADVILPKKRNYWIETNYSQYIHAHHKEDLDTLRRVLAECCPEYLPAFDTNMAQTYGHRFNMFIMRKDIADAYCKWLFDILFQLERELDITEYDAASRRVFGYVAERLIDTWIATNYIPYYELPVVNLERQNWIKKGGSFLLRKWRGRKNDKAKSANSEHF